MATVEYMSRGFVHIVESPPGSRWLRLRGPPIENFDLTGEPTTQAEIWQMRFNRHLRSLLIETWLNEYTEGWSVGLPFSHCLFFDFLVIHLLTAFSLSLGGYSGSRHRFSRWETFSTMEMKFHISVPWSCLHDTCQMKLEGRR